MTIERSWLTKKELALLDRLRAARAGLFLRGAEVRVCRVLVARGLARLEDHGEMREPGSGRSDGERWSAEAVREDTMIKIADAFGTTVPDMIDAWKKSISDAPEPVDG